jgi:ADP-ribose pyrophosphatase YjhB (NUDIX family)
MITPPTTGFVEDSHCGYCGGQFAEQKLWPRKCFRCYNDTFKNPLPVVVSILPVWDEQDATLGILIQQRNILPAKGEWALCGGYMNANESWENAIAREVQEEIGLITDPKLYHLMELVSNDHNNLLIFSYYSKALKWDEIHFSPNEEVSDIALAYEPMDLCFPSHTEQVRKYFTGKARS